MLKLTRILLLDLKLLVWVTGVLLAVIIPIPGVGSRVRTFAAVTIIVRKSKVPTL